MTYVVTDACIRCTLHGAFTRGYDATLVKDAHTTEDQTSWGAPPPDQVIAHTKLLGPGESDVIEFDAPAPGTYPFVCTFPGHAPLMNGQLVVQ